MKYLKAKAALGQYPLFSVSDLRGIEPGFDRRRLTEWQEKGYIQKLARGYYIFSDHEVDELLLFRIANRLYRPSYVSLECALSYYGIIPESVYAVTSVCTKRTREINTPLARMTYRTIRPHMFFGYDILPNGAKMASVEKALLDCLYLTPTLSTADDFEALRFNRESALGAFDRRRFDAYRSRFGKKALDARALSLMEWLNDA